MSKKLKPILATPRFSGLLQVGLDTPLGGMGLHSSTFQTTLSRLVTDFIQRIQHNVLMLSRNVDQCPPPTKRAFVEP
jgi:hypothetical protein